jgi:hypothetical protein
MPDARGPGVRPPLVELTLARVRELVREPEAVFWVFVFPILLAAILGSRSAAVRPTHCRLRSSTAPQRRRVSRRSSPSRA